MKECFSFRFFKIFLFSSLILLVQAAEVLSAENKKTEGSSQKQSINAIDEKKPQASEKIKNEYLAKSFRDPFDPYIKPAEEISLMVPQAAPLKPLPSVSVQGLMWGADPPLAIINNSVVKVGDSINEMEIQSIDKKGITILFQGKAYTLSVSDDTQALKKQAKK
jgi:hypothetical protein